MTLGSRVEFRYQPRYCTLIRKDVLAIVTQQSDGSWRIANCLDKDGGCFEIECAFTNSAGKWPYADSSASCQKPQANVRLRAARKKPTKARATETVAIKS